MPQGKSTKIKSFTLENSNKYSDFIDEYFSLALRNTKITPLPLVVATGGYGRRDMAPHSDVDVVFLTEEPLSAAGKKFIADAAKSLWGFTRKLSYSVRLVEDLEKDILADLHYLTSLLDMRYVAGPKPLYSKFHKKFQTYVENADKTAFVAAKLKEQDNRHLKMGDSRYQLQPNIKEGKGALRDIHTLLWISTFLFDAKTPQDLADKKVLGKREAASLAKALGFFQTVRAHMHDIAGRCEDRLSFELQPQVAERMGYTDNDINQRAEKFMRDYFLMTRETGYLTRILCADLEARSLAAGATAGTKKPPLKNHIEGFDLENNRLTVPSAKTFEDSPLEMLRLFRVGQTSGYDIHPDALRYMRQVDATIPPQAQTLFLDILTDRKGAEATLRRLSEAGILLAIIPEFENIHAHMQYDMYHVYTADEHTLRAVGMMHKIENGELAQEAPLSTRLFGEIHSRHALYAAMFFHDISKGTGGGHAQKGAEVARLRCPALGLSPEETETVAWLVENHLLMTMTAFKRDLNDPKTIGDFAALVQSPERLKLLTILTVADIMAVGPERWNNWKAGLLRELYAKTQKELGGGVLDNHSDEEHILILQKQARRLCGNHKKAFNTLIDHAPANFWHSFGAEEIARICTFMDGPSAARITPFENHDHSEVFIYTPDRKGLFATLSGTLAASGASIVGAKIFTLTNGMALDVFQVQNVKGGVYDNTAYLQRTLKAALKGTLDIEKEIAQKQKSLPRKAALFDTPTRVIIDNKASTTCTLVEVNAFDRPGLLYRVTSALAAQGLQISSAKITTFGMKAMDVFYVKDTYGLKILHPEKITTIENNLKQALENYP